MVTRLGKKIITQADFTPAHRRALLEQYCAGKTQEQLAKQVGTTATLIGKVLRSTEGWEERKPSRSGRPSGRANIPPAIVEAAKQLKAEGLTPRQIANRLGKTRSRVYQLLKDPRRPAPSWQK